MSHHFINCLRPTGLRAEYLPHVVPTTRHVVVRASLHFRVQSKSRRYGKVCGSNDDACFSIMNSLLLNKCINLRRAQFAQHQLDCAVTIECRDVCTLGFGEKLNGLCDRLYSYDCSFSSAGRRIASKSPMFQFCPL